MFGQFIPFLQANTKKHLPPTMSFIKAVTTSATASGTLTNFALGAEGPTRKVLVIVSSRYVSSYSSLTIGGVEATFIGTPSVPGYYVFAYYALIPTGSTATIAFTGSSTPSRESFVSAWIIKDGDPIGPTIIYTSAASSSSLSMPVTAPEGSCVAIGVSAAAGTAGVWTGATNRQAINSSSSSARFADTIITSSGSGTITISGGSALFTMMGVVWS